MQVLAFGIFIVTPSLKESGSDWSKWGWATQDRLWLYGEPARTEAVRPQRKKDMSLSLSYYRLRPLIKFSQKPEGKEAYAETV